MQVTNDSQCPLVDTQKISPLMAGNDTGKYTPSKPMYFQKVDAQQVCESWKEGLHKKRELKSLNSLSKMLKKKKQKNRNFEKHLCDPSIQVPEFKNLTKYLKKKKKTSGITLAKERGHKSSKIRIPVENNVLPTWDCRQKYTYTPENTFDLILANDSHLDERPQNIRALSNDFARSPPSQEYKPALVQLGNLIDLGTPETLKPKVIQNDKQPSAMLKIDEFTELCNFHPELSCFQQLSLIDFSKLTGPHIPDTPVKKATDSSGSDGHEDQGPNHSSFLVQGHELPTKNPPSGSDGILDHSNPNEVSEILGKSISQFKKVDSPQLLYSFAGLNSASEVEKQPTFSSGNTIEVLVARLERDPFPKTQRKNGKVIVRRRAFSMDGNVMEYLLCNSVEDCALDRFRSEAGLIEEASKTLQEACNQVEYIENEENIDSISEVENASIDRAEEVKRYTSNEFTSDRGVIPITLNSSVTLRPNTDSVDWTQVFSSTGTPLEELNCQSPLTESAKSVSIDILNVINTEEILKLSDNKNDSAKPFLLEEDSIMAPDCIKNGAQDLGLASGVEHEHFSPNEDTCLNKLSKSPFLVIENQVCGVIQETQYSGTKTETVGEPTNTSDSSLHQQISSDFDTTVFSEELSLNNCASSALKEIYLSIVADENECCYPIRCHSTSVKISIPTLIEENTISIPVISEIPVTPITDNDLNHSLKTGSACDNVNDNELTSDSTAQTGRKATADEGAAEKYSNISDELISDNGQMPDPFLNSDELISDNGQMPDPFLNSESCSSDDIKECMENMHGEFSADETNVADHNSTYVVEALNLEELHKPGRFSLVDRKEIQEHSSDLPQLNSSCGTINVPVLCDESEKCSSHSNEELEECFAEVTRVSDLNSTYVIDPCDSAESCNSDPVEVFKKDEIHENSSDAPPVDSSDGALQESVSGDESEDKTVELKERITDASFDEYHNNSNVSCLTPLEHWVLPAGKKFRRSLSIIRNLDEHPCTMTQRGRHYEKSVEEIVKLQGNYEARTPVQSLRKRISLRRSTWLRQITPPRVRRNTFMWSPSIPERGTLYETPHPRRSIYSTPMQQNVVRRMSVLASPILAPRKLVRFSFNQDCSPESPVQYTIRDLILTICKQNEPCSFSDLLDERSYSGGCKLGEGVFGEVFSINRECEHTVLKIIPIEGHDLINGEKQKTYSEVLSELIIAKVLHELRHESSDECNLTSGYAELISTSLVQGSYPETLLKFWEEFDVSKGSDNDNPRVFGEDQLFIVMEQGNGGKDLESYSFSSAKQSLSIFKQIAFSLAVAETSVEFEHRDLHWGNVLVSKTHDKQISFTLNGSRYSVASSGVKSTIIDYTLSRIKYVNQFPIYNDIGKDPEMFIATGDYQFDVYRLMKKDVEDDWSRFTPKTNARWLHYLLDKILTKVKYQRKTAKVHKDSLKVLEDIRSWIEECGSALSTALRLADMKN